MYTYRAKCSLILAPWEAEHLISLEAEHALIEVGHGAYTARARRRGESTVVEVPWCNLEVEVRNSMIREHLDERRMLAVEPDGSVRTVEVRSGGYYKLVPTIPRSYPTLEINGIHMHRVSGTDPRRDTIAKIRAARVRRGDIVLDTCMGLGYTAIHSIAAGARRVVTVEIDRNVLAIAEYNPWSHRLSFPSIEIINSDVTTVIREFEDESFDKIIHDPPRLTGSTGPLYGTDFYMELYRVLRKGGRLFHYTGEPGRKHGKHFPGKVSGKLKSVGFHVLGYDKRALGVVAVKL